MIRRPFVPLIATSAYLALAVSQGMAQEVTLQSLQTNYSNALNKLRLQHDIRLKPLKDKYYQELQQYRSSVKKKSDEDTLSELIAEEKRFLATQTIPREPAKNSDPNVARLQRNFNASAGGLITQRNRQVLRLTGDYIQRLESLKTELVQQEENPRARAASEELDQAKSTYTALRKTLRDDTKRLEAAVAAAPNDPQAILALGTRYNEEGNFDLANALLEPEVARFGTNGLLRLQYALSLHGMGQHEKALVQYRRTARQLPDDPQPWKRMSMIYEAMDRGEESYANLVQALYRAPNDPSMLRMVGETLRHIGLPEEGVRFFRRHVQLDPKNSGAHQQLGVFLYRQKRYDMAAEQFEMAIELDASNTLAYYDLGMLCHQAGRLEAAHRWLSQGLKIDPTNPNLRAGLAKLNQDQRRRASPNRGLPVRERQ
jgi:tetratricopeptide (TPR) repeat protein